MAMLEVDRVTRLIKFFTDQDYYWPIAQWPTYIRALALKPHMDFEERYTLFTFFSHNGLPRDLVKDWMLVTDVKVVGAVSSLSHKGYDDEAHRHVDSMIASFFQPGSAASQRRAPMHDMSLGHPI